MADLSRYLPLSQRPTGDESGVSTHWGVDIASTLEAVADLIGVVEPAALDAPSAHRGWSIRAVASHLLWRMQVASLEQWRATVFATVENGFNADSAARAIAERGPENTPAEFAAEFRRIAELKRAGEGRIGIRELAVATIAAIDIASPLEAHVEFRPIASGAVALRRALNAPTGIKAVVRNRTLTATDAGWTFGHGPEMADTAEAILLFLYDRSDRAPGAR